MRPCGDRPESLFRPLSGRYQDVERTLDGRHPDAIGMRCGSGVGGKDNCIHDAPRPQRACGREAWNPTRLIGINSRSERV
jgi:hypothetical protein